MEDSRIENQKHRIEVAKRDLEVAKRNRDEAKRIGNYQKSFKAYRSGTKEGTVWDSNVWVAQRHLEEERKHLTELREDIRKEKEREREKKQQEREKKQQEKEYQQLKREWDLIEKEKAKESAHQTTKTKPTTYTDLYDDSSSSSENLSFDYKPEYSSDNVKSFKAKPPKSHSTAGVLAILLGFLGVHYFYCKKFLAGITFLGISFIGGYLLNSDIVPGIVAVFSIIQGITMLTSSQNHFEEKYISTAKVFPLL